MRLSRVSVLPAILVALVGAAWAQDTAAPAGAPAATTPSAATQSAAEALKMVDAVRPSLVKVEYTLQYDKGEAPRSGNGGGWSRFGPDDEPTREDSGSTYVQEERPMQLPAFVLSPTQVIAPDIMMHPRFIKAVAVRVPGQGGPDKVVNAKPVAYMTGQRAVLLETAEPMPVSAKPLVFDETRKGPYRAITYGESDAEWLIGVHGVGGTLGVTESGRTITKAPARCLIVDKAGGPVGMVFNGDLPPDESWKGSPLRWPGISATELTKLLDATQKKADAGLVRVTLNFRTPKNGDNGGGLSRYRRSREDDESAPVQHALGVLVDSRTVLVLANLKAQVTARLERIKVQTGDNGGSGVEAKFSRTLLDYGAFVATLDKPLADPLELASGGAETRRDQLLPAAEMVLQGEKKVAYYSHRRVSGARMGWRQHKYPELGGDTDNVFVFARDGALLAFPIQRRDKASVESRYSSDRMALTNASQLKAVLADLDKNSDPGNVPLTEADENRLAWLGVELQGLTQELARANNVSDQTSDGETGALVTYVYPNSPAARAGVEPGWVLLRLNVEGQPKPIDVKVDGDFYADRAFPWDRLGDAPESVFDRIPTPWPNVETSLTRTLTDLGFGKKFTAEFYHDGKSSKKDFEVIQGPAHWNSAPKYKHAGLGLTVRDLTYEVRRYLQKKNDDPGVVISKIEMGSKASVAGLKPYELITEINGEPVKDTKDFQRLTAKGGEYRLAVKRMSRGRIVKVVASEGAASQPGTRAASPSATQNGGD